MSELERLLRKELLEDKAYAHAYMEQFVDSYIATQIKVLREMGELTQAELAENCGMKQSRISLLENVNYDSWSVNTLRKLARAFDVVLKVSFEKFSVAIEDAERMSRESLERAPRETDLAAPKRAIHGVWSVTTSYAKPIGATRSSGFANRASTTAATRTVVRGTQ